MYMVRGMRWLLGAGRCWVNPLSSVVVYWCHTIVLCGHSVWFGGTLYLCIGVCFHANEVVCPVDQIVQVVVKVLLPSIFCSAFYTIRAGRYGPPSTCIGCSRGYPLSHEV